MDRDEFTLAVTGVELVASTLTVEISYAETEGSTAHETTMLVSFKGEALTFFGAVGGTENIPS